MKITQTMGVRIHAVIPCVAYPIPIQDVITKKHTHLMVLCCTMNRYGNVIPVVCAKNIFLVKPLSVGKELLQLVFLIV